MPPCSSEGSGSSSEEERSSITVSKTQTRRPNTPERRQHGSITFGEGNEKMLKIAQAKAPPVSKKQGTTQSQSSTKKKKSVRPVVPHKRSTPQHRGEESKERPSKVQKTNQSGAKPITSKGGSSLAPICLEDEDDDTLSRQLETAPKIKKNEVTEGKSFFQGLGVRNSRSTWSFAGNSNQGTVNTSEDADLIPSPMTPGEQATRSASKNFSQYQKSIAGSDPYAKRVAQLESELATCKRDYEARIETMKLENDAKVRRMQQDHVSMMAELRREHEATTQQTMQDRETQINNMRQDYETRLHQSQREHESQAEAQSQETKTTLDDIQRTITEQDGEKVQQITVLQTENHLLKDRLKVEKAAHEQLIKDLDQREVFVDTEESVKALEAKNATLSQEIETLKRQRDQYSQEESPTPTHSSSLHASDEMKTTNVRKMFLKIKRKHDTLITVSKKIHDVTINMDLAAWGEFGKHIKDLRKAMEINGDEDGGASQSNEGDR
ncbi:uncharacterized protein N0V89_009593 [Didymosphaeria variabile]|uniref:Uncharacterized protein n=1 Tax=Didymosphaeria variabile TaxID=1932322 RepID=A0A9W9C7F5_9PLEO|nr:uncharacterized protein N0V89_009593 [Didymosphaeria variabile]KAJ4348221.1 hypothetical protein N0V89_009593 [Didymosphaeria variabile]